MLQSEILRMGVLFVILHNYSLNCQLLTGNLYLLSNVWCLSFWSYISDNMALVTAEKAFVKVNIEWISGSWNDHNMALVSAKKKSYKWNTAKSLMIPKPGKPLRDYTFCQPKSKVLVMSKLCDKLLIMGLNSFIEEKHSFCSTKSVSWICIRPKRIYTD